MYSRDFYYGYEEEEETDEEALRYARRADSQMDWMEGYLDALDQMEKVYQEDDKEDAGSLCIKMIGLDLDGTVLNNKKEITNETALAIEDAAAAGIVVVPVTGRPLSGIPKEIISLKGIRYAITSNGAVTYDLETKTVCDAHFLDRKSALESAAFAESLHFIYSVFVDGIGYSTLKEHENVTEFYAGTPLASYVADSRRPVVDMQEFLQRDNKSVFSDHRMQPENAECVENIWIRCIDAKQGDYAEKMLRQICPEGNIMRMLPEDLEMVAKDADKGDAFVHLAESLGISPDAVMAIGDSINDIGFMKKAGLSIAMGNSAQMIKDLADYTTADNEHDGAALAIRKFCGL